MPPDNPIDHVRPWSLVGADGLATWSAYNRSERLDISFPPWWIGTV